MENQAIYKSDLYRELRLLVERNGFNVVLNTMHVIALENAKSFMPVSKYISESWERRAKMVKLIVKKIAKGNK